MSDSPAAGALAPSMRPLDERGGSPRRTPRGGRASRAQLAKTGKAPDRTFSGAALAAGFLIVVLVAFVGAFLVIIAAPSIAADKVNFLTSTQWTIGDGNLAFGILGLFWTTLLSSVVAMAIAVPIAIGTALLITQYLRSRIGGIVGFLIDLLAAVPSIVYGLWGLKVLGPALEPLYRGLTANLGWIPLFAPGVQSTGNVLTASLVLSVMILPIISAISRDVFAQTPKDQVEAALALGATRWEVIRMAVLPHGRSGVIAASMLGLGRALGETVAVMIILSATNSPDINFSLFAGGETFASKIANNAAEFDTPTKTGAYVAAGLVLFVVTFVVNGIARVVADRGKARA